MYNWLLIGVLIYLGFQILNGYHKGFIRIALSMVALIITIVAVSVLSPYVSKFLSENTELYNKVQEKAEALIVEGLEEQADNILVSELENREKQIEIISKLPIPKTLRDSMGENNNSEIYQLLGVNSFSEYLSSYLAYIILNAIAFAATFVVVGFLIQCVVFMADLLSKLPIINGINKFAGILIGLAKGIVVLWILCLFVTAFVGTGVGSLVLAMIEDSLLLSFIYNHNYLLEIITNLVKILI